MTAAGGKATNNTIVSCSMYVLRQEPVCTRSKVSSAAAEHDQQDNASASWQEAVVDRVHESTYKLKLLRHPSLFAVLVASGGVKTPYASKLSAVSGQKR